MGARNMSRETQKIERLKDRLVKKEESMRLFFNRHVLNKVSYGYPEFLEIIHGDEKITKAIGDGIDEYMAVE